MRCVEVWLINCLADNLIYRRVVLKTGQQIFRFAFICRIIIKAFPLTEHCASGVWTELPAAHALTASMNRRACSGPYGFKQPLLTEIIYLFPRDPPQQILLNSVGLWAAFRLCSLKTSSWNIKKYLCLRWRTSVRMFRALGSRGVSALYNRIYAKIFKVLIHVMVTLGTRCPRESSLTH